jgi:hypothetical protein
MNRDYLKTVNGDLLIVNGDFVVGESDQQHIEDIFITNQGEYKEWPLLGFGAINYIKSRVTDAEFKRDLKIQLAYDDYIAANIDTSNGIENVKIEI